MKRWLREPLLHFALAGAALFAAYAFIGRGRADGGGERVVRIGPGEVAWLRETWTRQWQRPPSQEELRGQVTEFLKEELLAREARSMGLDQGDTIVRRRLAQKLEFLMQDTARLAEPSDADLERFYGAHPDLFRSPARLSFSHVYFGREHRRDAAGDARTALLALSRNDPSVRASELGDRLMIDYELRDADEQSIAAQFGPAFSAEIMQLEPGTWQGPIESAYGLHLVRVERHVPAAPRAFAEVRTQALERWRSEREREQGERYFAALLKKYDVTVDEAVKPLVGPLDGPIAAVPQGSGEGEVR
jgi:hypothetical protein